MVALGVGATLLSAGLADNLAGRWPAYGRGVDHG
jgi:hypothetical protein